MGSAPAFELHNAFWVVVLLSVFCSRRDYFILRTLKRCMLPVRGGPALAVVCFASRATTPPASSPCKKSGPSLHVSQADVEMLLPSAHTHFQRG